MASPATAALNGASGNHGPSAQNSIPQTTISGKQQNKANANNKSGDGGRRATASPVDGSQRRLPTQKAWTQGTNPITGQRPPNFNHQNGNATQTKSAGSAKTMAATSKETNTPDKHANDRLLFLLGNFIGLPATITTKNREKFEGLFSGASLESPESIYMLSMARKITSAGDGSVNGVVPESTQAYIGEGPSHRMVFETKDVVDLTVGNVSLNEAQPKAPNGVTTGFKTDADISGNLTLRERNLQRWEPSSTTDVDLSLESPGTSWNQFETNERLTGIKSDYDETIYTTSIDRSNPLYKQRAAAAERIAREIESGTAMNAHMAEERGLEMADDTGMDEEQKYSGVHRGAAQNQNTPSNQPNKYTPPARRPPTGQPTVAGAPVDPAIISSQIARAPPSSMAASNGKATPRLPLRSSPTVKPIESTNLSDIKGGGPQQAASSIAATAHSKVVPSMRATGELDSMQSRLAASPGQSTSASPNRVPGRTEDATANVESELLQSFKEFSSTEKMKFIERKRNQAKHDKDIKLNDLMKFSKNFQLKTPVPKDLVPILAKDKTKQEEIMEKAQRNAAELSNQTGGSVIRPHNALVEPRAQRNPATASFTHGNAAPLAPADRQNGPRGRPGHFNMQPMRGDRPQQAPNLPIISPRAGVPLSGRLADIHQRHKAGGAPLASVTSPGPIQEARQPPTGPAVTTTDLVSSQRPSPAPTPTSAVSTRFNAKAMEFRPNPAAISFTPTGDPSAASSPRSSTNVPQLSRAASPSSFFGTKKPLPASERPSLDAALHPIKRMKKEALAEGKDYNFNGNIEPAYKTPPTWPVTNENKDKKYTDLFEPTPVPATSTAIPRPSHSTAQLPHQHQLPFHLQSGAQGVPQLHTPQQNPPQLHSHQHQHPAAPHHFDDHRMHFSSSTSSMQPSPRLNQVNMAYPSPMIQHTQLSYGQPMPQYALGPGAPQIAHMRQFQGGPQFVHPQAGHAAPMMVHQTSGGPYMGVPQGVGVQFNPHVPMYSPAQGHAYPHPNGPPPLPPGSSGYPSPGRGAPMMMHQGSQQGQPPQQLMWMSPAPHMQPLYTQQQPGQMMRGGYPPPPPQQQQQQPHYAPSPHQQHHQPQQHRGHPSGNYGQVPAQAQHGPSHQAPPPAAPANHENDDAK